MDAKVERLMERFDSKFDSFQLQMFFAVFGIFAATLGSAFVRNQPPASTPQPVSSVQQPACQDPGPDKLYSTLRWMTSWSFICAFWAVAWW